MAKATKKRLAKKRGRPATGQSPMIGLRLPDEITAKIDTWAERNGLSRSDAIRLFIERGLSKPS